MARIPVVTATKSIDTGGRTMPRLETPRDGAALSALGGSLQSTGTELLAREVRAREALEDFTTDEKFRQHSMRMAARLDEDRQKAPAGGAGLTESYIKTVDEENNKWLQSGEVPSRLADRYRVRTGTLRQSLEIKAAEAENTDRNTYFKSTITSQAGSMSARIVDRPDDLLTARDGLFNAIDRSTLAAAEKASLKSHHGMTMAKAGIEGLVRQGRYDEARELSKTVAGFGRGGGEGGPVVMTDEARASRDAITKEADAQGIPADLAIAVASLESGLSPKARNKHTGAGGLFQIMPEESAKNGNIGEADIESQARYGVARLKRDAADIQGRGLPVTPVTVYMAHFQGAAATEKILKADPSASLRDTLDSARPGWKSKDGESWGEIVIRQNSLDPKSTAGQFVDKITRRVTGAQIAAASTEVGYGERASLVERTETEIRSHEAQKKREQAQTILETKNMVENDIQSILATGKEVGELNEKRVTDHLGEEASRQWMQKREGARRFHATTKDFDVIPSDQIEDRLTLLAHDKENKGGSVGFVSAESVYNEARKKADGVLKMRRDDPARAVEQDPEVRGAMAGLNNANPATIQNLVDKRIAAQQRIGVPPNAIMPVTAMEAQQMAQVLIEANDVNRPKIVNRMVTETVQKYGKHADAVLTAVVGQYVKDRETASMMAGAIRKLASGGKPTPIETLTQARAVEADQSRQAMTGQTWWQGQQADPDAVAQLGGARSGQGKPAESGDEFAKFVTSFKPLRPWDPGDVGRLQKNPELGPAFDERYGKGAANHMLKALEMALNRGEQAKAKEAKPNG